MHSTVIAATAAERRRDMRDDARRDRDAARVRPRIQRHRRHR
jgi:hypothetical protein